MVDVVDGVVTTHKGTGVGRLLADLLFSFCPAIQLSKIRKELALAGLIVPIDWSSCRSPFAGQGSVAQLTPADATYVDDITLRTFAVHATDATRITSLPASIALTVLSNEGLSPNM